MDGDMEGMGAPYAGEGSPSYYRKLQERLGAWTPGPLAVLLYVDLRHLGEINRMAGAAEGDRIIRRVEQVLGEWAGAQGLSGRLWSNEFVAAKAIDHTQAAGEEAAQLRDRLVEVRYQSAIGPSSIGVSIGLSVWRENGDWERVLAEGQQACLLSKQRGLNQIVRFSAGGTPLTPALYSPLAVHEFRQLAQQRQLCLHAQPIMDITRAEPRLAKAECLMRIDRDGVHVPLGGGVIETLEHFGLASELDRYTASYMLDWLDAQPEMLTRVDGLSMNLSGASLVDGHFIDQLFADFKHAHLPADRLWFEITETAAIRHLDVAAEVIAAFRSIGCRFSLDDFGSGLCSFGYLHSLPVDEVKIDGCFVRDIVQNAVSQEIVRAIHHVAKVTGKRTVAEFVDDARKLETLRRIGIDYAQGWLFYPAVPLEKLQQMLRPR